MSATFAPVKLCVLKMHIFILLAPSMNSQRANLPYVCHRGTYLHTPRIGPEFCLPCTDSVNFMQKSLHRERICINCTQVRDENLEVLVSPCNKTHDTEILCRDGYYRYKARNIREKDICVKCSDCEHIARRCQGYYDHVCCLPSYEAVLNKHGFYECKERPIVCGAGEFLSSKTEQCTPCPPGTFMTSDKHNHTNCQLCQTLDDVGPHQEIVQPCNRTHKSIFGCQAGYYKDEKIENMDKENSCWPCGLCERTLQECGPIQDSICCDGPDVQLQETELGKSCLTINTSKDGTLPNDHNIQGDSKDILPRSPETFCGTNEYLHVAVNGDRTCLACPEGTVQIERNHNLTVCKAFSLMQDKESPFNKGEVQKQTVESIHENILFYILWLFSLLFFSVSSFLVYILCSNNFKCILHHIIFTLCGFLLSFICLTVTFLALNFTSFTVLIIVFVGYILILFKFRYYTRYLSSQEDHEE